MSFQEIQAELLTILESSGQQLPSEQVADMKELVQAGEPGIALENFCTQLFEYDVTVPEQVRVRLQRLGEKMGVRRDYWERLATKRP
jgi:hypothetical protein